MSDTLRDAKIAELARRVEVLEQAQRWITVGERLPRSYQHVIAFGDDYDTDKVGPAKFIDGVWYDQDVIEHGSEWPELHSVTHWIPLPEPPPEESSDE